MFLSCIIFVSHNQQLRMIILSKVNYELKIIIFIDHAMKNININQ